jgi:uncharacterized membrane protein YtjA (UPF0391 family)
MDIRAPGNLHLWVCERSCSPGLARRLRDYHQMQRALRFFDGCALEASASDTRLAKGAIMLHYALVFFVIALIAALFGFGGIAAGAAEIAKVLFFIFLVLFIVSLVLGLFRRGS